MAEQKISLPIEICYDDMDPSCVKWILFKDQTTGTKYMLKVDNGVLALEEVVE